jgi:hypothetical protein
MKRIAFLSSRDLGENRIVTGGTATLFTCLVGLLLVSSALARPAEADSVLVSVSNGNPGAGGVVVASTQYLQESWTQNTSYTNVNISAWLFGDLGPGGFVPRPGTAYLTSSVPGAPELVQTFVFPDPGPNASAVNMTLFSGLTLPAGTYFLTLASTDPEGGGWADCLAQAPCTVTLADRVSLANDTFTPPSSVDPANPPLSGFISTVPNDQLFFAVTAVTTPEPNSMVLLCFGSLILGLMILYRRRFAN